MSEVRVELLPEDIAEPRDLVSAIRMRRGGTLARFDRAMLNSPTFTEGWSEMAPRVRNRSSLSPAILELAICTVAVLTRTQPEINSHFPLLQQAGASETKLQALKGYEPGADLSAFTETERTVIELAAQMTRNVVVEDAVFDRVKRLFSDREIVDLVGTIGFYNMACRFIVALNL